MTTGGEVQEGWNGQLPFLKPPPAAKPHHLGHRERLRERALNGGLSALPDYEALELFLYRIYPRGDVKPLAKDLLKRFGSLAGVLAAPIDDLCAVRGVGEAAALEIKLVHELAQRIGL